MDLSIRAPGDVLRYVGRMPTDPEILTLNEAAELLRLTPSGARALARRGDLPGGVKVGGEWRVNRTKLIEHLGLDPDASYLARESASS